MELRRYFRRMMKVITGYVRPSPGVEIKAGDWVIVRRRSLCCDSDGAIGNVFQVTRVAHSKLHCDDCGANDIEHYAGDGTFGELGEEYCVELQRLEKLPGLTEEEKAEELKGMPVAEKSAVAITDRMNFVPTEEWWDWVLGHTEIEERHVVENGVIHEEFRSMMVSGSGKKKVLTPWSRVFCKRGVA